MTSMLTDQYPPAPVTKLRRRNTAPAGATSTAITALTTIRPAAHPATSGGEAEPHVIGTLAPFLSLYRTYAAHAARAARLRDPLAGVYEAFATELATAIEDAQRGAGAAGVAAVALATGLSPATVKRHCTTYGPRVGAVKQHGGRTWLIDLATFQSALPQLLDGAQEAA